MLEGRPIERMPVVYYVVRCGHAGDSSAITRPTATEAAEALDKELQRGWSLVEVSRNRPLITEADLRQDAQQEIPMMVA